MYRNILQIIPATDNAYATYKEDEGTFGYLPVFAWALVEDIEGNRSVIGLEDSLTGSSDLIFCDSEGFDGYNRFTEEELKKIEEKDHAAKK